MPLLQELQVAAAEAELPLPRYVVEILESFAAARRLPKVDAPHGNRIPRERDGEFPFPADTFTLRIPVGSDRA